MSSIGLTDQNRASVPSSIFNYAQKTPFKKEDLIAVINEKLTLEAFQQLSGTVSGQAFVKIVVDSRNQKIHFLNHQAYPFHIDYIAIELLGLSQDEMFHKIDGLNESVYHDPQRQFYLGLIAFHKQKENKFFTLETVEVDTMSGDMLKYFYDTVKTYLDPALPLYLKPANHDQENAIAGFDPTAYPHIYNYELYANENFIALNPGKTHGRLKIFSDLQEYKAARKDIEWYDIICMPRVPDDIPRISGIINSAFTTPLSHTNVLAHGWQIPNAIQLGILHDLRQKDLHNKWVEYEVDRDQNEIRIAEIPTPTSLPEKPAWKVHQIKLEKPETEHTPIIRLDELRGSDRFRYGTKAANLGELRYLLDHGSERLTGFYRIKRPPRDHLLPYLAKFLGISEQADLEKVSWDFLRRFIHIPSGIAIPFSIQQNFLESSPQIQQCIGKLKMALELNVKDIEPLCYQLQNLIRQTRMTDEIRNHIDAKIAKNLAGVSSFVIRSSSNAEDLEGFSAAGIYESLNHITTAENIFQSIKEVWASLLSARSVRLRQEVGISLDDCYMGVIVQEEVPSDMGGVLISTNPTDHHKDFRNVYINVSTQSVTNIVNGSELPLQYLYNTVEGNGRTLSIGSAKEDLSKEKKLILHRLAFAARLLQSHFSPDYTFSHPIDVEWVCHNNLLYILQLRPYAG